MQSTCIACQAYLCLEVKETSAESVSCQAYRPEYLEQEYEKHAVIDAAWHNLAKQGRAASRFSPKELGYPTGARPVTVHRKVGRVDCGQGCPHPVYGRGIVGRLAENERERREEGCKRQRRVERVRRDVPVLASVGAQKWSVFWTMTASEEDIQASWRGLLHRASFDSPTPYRMITRISP